MRCDAPIEVSLQHFRVFLVLGEELHFGRAAERLQLSQPYVSRTLAALERHVGGRLVDRTSRAVRLTPLGASFHADLDAAWGGLASAIAHARARASDAAATLVVGCTVTSAGIPLTTLIRRFESEHPEHHIQLREVSASRPYEALENGRIDVLVFWQPSGDAPGVRVGGAIDRQPRVVMMRRGHPLSTRESVTLDDVADYGVPAMARVAYGAESVSEAIYPTRTPSGREVPHLGTPGRTIAELADQVARTDAVKPTVALLARVLGDREDIVSRPLADVAPLALGPIWLAADDDRPAIRALDAVSRAVAARR